MLFRTHLAFSFLIGLIIVDFFKISNNILFLILFLFFSLIPDLDEHSSKISRKLKFLSFFLKSLFKHRGFLHSIFIPFLSSLFLFIINRKFLGLAVILGYLSHLILDAFTIKGIKPLYPLIDKRIRGFIKVGSFLENVLFFIILVLVVYKLL